VTVTVAYADCSWRVDAAGRPEAHKRLSVAPAGGARLVPCVSPRALRRRWA